MIGNVVKKELRGYFNSAIAVIFLAAFLVVTFYTFFWREKFFARGVADLRPLFEWMPRLMIILVSALAMRLWSDERRAGTLEVLLTLPVPRWQLVVGKFLAGLLLVATALALTLGLPITISLMGNLDLGPVAGGYLAALLLSAAYLAIGMCVSAATDNQIVAFVGTALACGIAYALGDVGGELGRFLGTGARFESVARGVLDVRDLAYYGAIVAIGIAINVLLLQRLSWSRGPRARGRRISALVVTALVIANAIALVVWLSPVRRARIDLTQDGTFSLSPATQRILAGLDEPLLIRGYFSDKTHPQLAPLIPQIRDLLDEYRIANRSKLRVEIVDPSESDDAKRDAKERFGIDPTPLRFASKNEKSVINAYFAIAIEYGDQHAVLALDDLISVRVLDIGDVEIRLQNLEYQVTKTIKKTVAEFSSVDALFASTASPVRLTAYVSSKGLPENWKDAPAKLQKAVDKLKKQAAGKLEFTTLEPKTEAEMQDLFAKYGLRPYQDLLGGQVFYFHLLLQVGERIVRITPPETLGESELDTALVDGLKRAAPGFTRVVGLWQPPADQAMQGTEGMPPQQMPPPQTFQQLEAALAGNYEVRSVVLTAPVPEDVEVLVLAGPANLDAKAAEHVDQFVMRGGSLVALAGRHRLAPMAGLGVEKVKTGLEDMFAKWGITVGEDMVMDAKSDAIPVPENRQLGNGLVVRELHHLPYPYFVKLDGDQLGTSIITGGLAGAVMHWVSPVKANPKVGDTTRRVDVLMKSSGNAWLSAATNVEPNFQQYPEAGFPKSGPKDKTGPQVLAVALTGGFASSLAKPEAKPDAPKTAPRLAHSPPDTRVVVFGSSAFVSDDMLAVARQLESDLATMNVELVHNAIDWCLADTDLLSIRARNAASHTLTIDPASRDGWRTANLAIAFAGLVIIVVATWLRRRAVTPLEVR
jgi:ABC-2 type transport system permease protein